MRNTLFHKTLSLILCGVLLLGYLPAVSADEVSTDVESTVTETVTVPLVSEGDVTVTEPATTVPEVFEDYIEYEVSTDGEVTITEYYGSAVDIVIPDTVKGMPVVAIGEECFCGNEKIESVVIPDSVVSIAQWAFCRCGNLQDVTFGTGLKQIGFAAFTGCNLQEPVLPEGLEYIDDNAFHGNFYMTSINIPSTVTHIGAEAFAYCWNLEEISTIPESVTYIGTGAFLSCYKLPAIWVDENNPNYSSDSQGVLYNKSQSYLYRIPGGYQGDYVMPDTVVNMASWAGNRVDSTGKLTISNNLTVIPANAFSESAYTELDLGTGVETIGDNAFMFCSLLGDFEIPASVTKIGDYAFESCDDLRSMTIPETVQTFGIGIFYGCEDLNYVYLPDGMTYIPEKMFAECEYLISIELPETVTGIGDEAFYWCERLKQVIIPEGVRSIGDRAFEFCHNMNSIIFQGDAPEIGAYAMDQMTTTCYYPAGNSTWTEDVLVNYGTYSYLTWVSYETGNSPWDPDSQLPEGLTYEIVNDNVVITGYTGTETDIIIPPLIEGYPVQYIGEKAFYQNETLESISLPATISKVRNSAFRYCTNLKSVIMADGPTYIGTYAFAYCTSLETLVLPQTLTGIDESAFGNCDSLTSFTFPDSVDIIADSVLTNCDNLVSVTLPQSARSISEYAFGYSTMIKSIVIPASVYSISDTAFIGCSGLEEIRVYDSNPYFRSEDGVLLSDSGTVLRKYPMGKTGAYTVPDTVTTIGSGSFMQSTITELVLPESVETIEEYAFEECEELTTVTMGQNVSNVSSMAFYRNPALTAIWVHADNTNYSSDEYGVLFNGDKTELVKYPLGRAGEYTVPDSVWLIGEYSFFSCQAELCVTVPSTVEEISTDAFTDCPNLRIRCYVGSCAESYVISDDIPYEYISGVRTLSIESEPQKLAYAIGSEIKTYGLCLYATLENGDTVSVEKGFTVDPVDTSTAGEKTVTVWWSGLSVSYTVTVDASLVDYPESDHPYAVNADETWTYVHGTDAEELLITFSEECYVESNYDHIYIYDGNGDQVGAYTGSALAGQTVTVPGNSFSIRLTSDEMLCDYGFTIVSIEAVGAVEETTEETTETTQPVATVPEGLSYFISGSTVTITGYSGTAEELNIPAYIGDCAVRYVADKAFYNNDTITSIILPETLVEIGASAFCFCENLSYAQIPSGTTIGSWAFAWCNALAEISLPEDLTSIGESAFYDCGSLTEIVIPDGVTAIPEGLFEDCVSLVSITLPQDAESIGAAAFAGCSSLETLTIPANVISIADISQESVFERCSSLSAIFVEDANTSYDSDGGVLYNAAKTQLLLCPAAKTGTYTVPDTVGTICEKAFEGSKLTEIILPEALDYIGAYAFSGSSITTITIPKNVTTLDWDRFEGCSDLATIWVSEENENFSSDEYGVLFDKNKTVLIRVPLAFEGPYTAPEGLLIVGNHAFAQCNGITEVVLPEGLEEIGGYAFYGSPSLTYVTLPASITHIGDEVENPFVFAESPNLIARCVVSTYSANWVAGEGVPYEYVDGVSSISITTLPAKLTYAVGAELRLSGMILSAELENGATVTVTSGFTADEVDMSTAGTKTVRVWWSNCSATFEIVVDASLADYPESDHPYAENADETWKYVHSTDAEELLITFSEDTETEANYDFIYIYDGDGNEVGQYSGTALAGQTVTVPGNAFTIRLTSDDGVCYNGFAITKVEAVGTETETTEPIESEPVETEPVATEPVEEIPDGLVYEIVGDAVTITGYTGTATELTIPDTIEGYPVTCIGSYAFNDNSSLTQVTIPDSVTSIDSWAFYLSSGLISVTIGNSVTSIGAGAFYSCINLTSIIIPDNVTSIGASTFSYCSSLASVTIPDGVTSIGYRAFYFCESLTSVTIPDSVTDIDSSAFSGDDALVMYGSCGSYAETYAQENEITFIYTDAVVSLEIVTLPDKLVYPVGGLIDLTGLTLTVAMEDGTVKTITSGYTVAECDTSTAGVKTVIVSLGGLTVSFEITVDASIPVYPESDHPYACSMDETWTYVHNEEADELHITFSDDTEVESNYDYIYILDGNGEQVGQYTGTALAGQTVTVIGNSFSIRLTTDGSVVRQGFTVTNVEAVVYCKHPSCDWTVTQKPTFTTVGQQQAVCPDCGETVTQEIACLEGKVDRWNISLQDDLQVNFHLAISESIASTAKVKILVGDEAVTYRASALEMTEDGLYIASANIAAAQMTDYIIVMVLNGGSVGSTTTYTVRQYADTVLADESLSAYHDMVKEMLNYGAAAQAYFDYEADMPANEGITGVGAAEVPETADSDMSVTGAANGIYFYAATLSYRDKVALRFYFKASGGVEGLTFTAGGTQRTPIYKDGMYYIEVPGITPEDLDQSVELTVTDTSGNTLTVCYSPMNYIVRMSQKGSDELKVLLKALYNYHLAAKALRTAS